MNRSFMQGRVEDRGNKEKREGKTEGEGREGVGGDGRGNLYTTITLRLYPFTFQLLD